MRTAKRISAAVMAAFLLAVSCVMTAGCGRKSKAVEKIPEDEDWYSFKKTQVGAQFQADKNISSSYMDFIGAADGKAVFKAEIQKITPDSKSPDFSNNVEDMTFFEIYDKNGHLDYCM